MKLLPETASLPSVPDFVECFLSGTRQRGYLPSAREKALSKQLALGKEVGCRVLSTRQRPGLPSVGYSANQNTRQRAAAVNGRQPPLTLCRVSSPDTRQSGDLPSVIFWHSANHIFFFHFWPPNFFCSPYTIPGTPCSNVAHFSDFFYISLIYFI